MKRKKMLEAMSLINEEYVSASEPAAVRMRREGRKTRIKKLALAACLMLAFTALNLWLFLPPAAFAPSVAKYKGNEYYEIIKEVNVLYNTDTRYKNNFGKVMAIAKNIFSLKVNDSSAPTNGTPTSGLPQYYVETTDNQTAGVTEADIVKRSNRYIYYMRKGSSSDAATLAVYEPNGDECPLVGEYNIKASGAYTDFDFYLSEDCRTVTVIYEYSSGYYNAETEIISLDVSNPASIRFRKKITVSGAGADSRLVDGKILLVNEFKINDYINFSKEETFIPQIYGENGAVSVPAENIIIPENASFRRYTVLYEIDEATLEVDGCMALLSYSDNFYVSADSVYLMQSYASSKENEITRIRYSGEGLENMGTVSIAGYAKDQYSFDEFEGVLRAVTTTRAGAFGDKTSASLWCIDIESMKVIASVENFAPLGETVRSVRFDGNLAYVCTAIQVQDPVFFFDLSDLDNITYKDTGTIEGFSTSLINLGDGFLLGMGRGSAFYSLKVEIYEESENGVVSVAKYELDNVMRADDYKAYYIDREKGLFGFGISDIRQQNGKYIMLGFNGYELYEVFEVELGGRNERKRAVFIDGYFYIFGDEGVIVEKIG